MDQSIYQLKCSQKILKELLNMIKDEEFLSCFNNDYFNFCDDNFDYTWKLISTSLLISENLDKYDKTYMSFSNKTKDLIEEKLLLSERTYSSDFIYGPCLLDRNNNVVDSFSDYVKCAGIEEIYDNYSYEYLDEIDMDEIIENSVEHEKMYSESKKHHDNLLIDGPHGCNESIFDGNLINIDKLIKRIRNSLAHSNYEVIDSNYIRLYHYNQKTNELDFNIIMNSTIVVIIIDELNEIANKKYTNFMKAYNNCLNYDFEFKENFTEEDYLKYIMSFDIFDEEISKKILDKSKGIKKDRLSFINYLIYETIRPTYDAGIIINNYLYCDKQGKIIKDELYKKYGFYHYLNSEYYDSSTKNNDDETFIINKFKFLLLSFLNSALLSGYNINENSDIEGFFLEKVGVDEQFKNKIIQKTKVMFKQKEEQLEKLEQETLQKQELVNQKEKLIKENNIQNKYYLETLPNEIIKINNQIENNDKKCDILREKIKTIKEEGYISNYSKYVFRSLRNSLAHGYVSFSKDIDLDNVSNTNIIFEDYNPLDKKELTFRGTISLDTLLNILVSEDYVSKIFNPSDSKKLLIKSKTRS